MISKAIFIKSHQWMKGWRDGWNINWKSHPDLDKNTIVYASNSITNLTDKHTSDDSKARLLNRWHHYWSNASCASAIISHIILQTNACSTVRSLGNLSGWRKNFIFFTARHNPMCSQRSAVHCNNIRNFSENTNIHIVNLHHSTVHQVCSHLASQHPFRQTLEHPKRKVSIFENTHVVERRKLEERCYLLNR